MSWRSVQLGQQLCDQDNLILELFKHEPVKYVGEDLEFQKHLTVSNSAPNLILILNYPLWCSDVIKMCRSNLTDGIDKFYIGVNRYTLLGNDTTRIIPNTGQHGLDYVNFLKSIVEELDFCVTRTGTLDNDLGRYFNFVQPLTWVYGRKATNKSNHAESSRISE